MVGMGEDKTTPNKKFPKHLYTGITLVGKEAVIPAAMEIGRNCIIQPWCSGDDFPADNRVATAETVS